VDTFVVPDDRVGLELDEFLALTYPLLNKGYLRRQVRAGRILLDGLAALPSKRLRVGQVLCVDFDEEADAAQPPEAPVVQVPVLYEDEDVLVVDKPAGLAVEPERWQRGEACLAGALLELALVRSGSQRPQSPAHSATLEFRPRLVHRIDKGTSGIVLVARNLQTERRLRAAFESGAVHKEYLALVEGEWPPGPPSGVEDGEDGAAGGGADPGELIDLPLGPDPRRSGRMQVLQSKGKPSQTRVYLERPYRGYSLVRCLPLTGRTHQIRVHLAARGFPLAVDALYGRREEFLLSEIKAGYRPKPGRTERPLIERLTLHARALSFPDGAGNRIEVEAPLHRDFERVLKQLAKVRAPRI
jgi:23S rRNA-/tRNA-specific pseudouridylate synthase